MIQHKLLALIGHYGYIGIFGALALGIIGLPVPDEVLMTFAGFLISHDRLHYVPAVAVAAAGSFTGMSVSYFVGYRLGYPVIAKYGEKIHITRDRLDRTQRWFDRFGKFALTVGYFIPGVRHLTAYSAGIGKWPYRSFALYAAPGSLLWAATFITLGRYLGSRWRFVAEALHRYLLLGAVGAIVIVLAVWLVRRERVRV